MFCLGWAFNHIFLIQASWEASSLCNHWCSLQIEAASLVVYEYHLYISTNLGCSLVLRHKFLHRTLAEAVDWVHSSRHLFSPVERAANLTFLPNPPLTWIKDAMSGRWGLPPMPRLAVYYFLSEISLPESLQACALVMLLMMAFLSCVCLNNIGPCA